MKEYKLQIPEHLNDKKQEITEFLLVKHYEDGILSAGSCAIILGIEKYHFQSRIEPKYENS